MGLITAEIDLTQVVLYAFWIFFAGLILYLRREDKREGYPLLAEGHRIVRKQGFPAIPSFKTFRLADGSIIQRPTGDGDTRPIAAKPTAGFPGAPLEPTGNPMLDGVGPGSYAERQDVPDMSYHGEPKIVPLRVATSFWIEERDPDPRGLPVYGADNVFAGTVKEVWVDRAEYLLRYFEMTLVDGGDILLPVNFSRVAGGRVNVKSILGGQFKDVPKLANPDQVTRLEEDRITAYYGSGHLYATPERSEPLV